LKNQQAQVCWFFVSILHELGFLFEASSHPFAEGISTKLAEQFFDSVTYSILNALMIQKT